MEYYQLTNEPSISKIGYEEETHQLIVLYYNGEKVIYESVPMEHYQALKSAERPVEFIEKTLDGSFRKTPPAA